jgi:hypothetical protein
MNAVTKGGGVQIQKDEILLRLINTQFDLLLKEKLSRQGLKSGSSDPRVKKSSAPKGEPVTAARSGAMASRRD